MKVSNSDINMKQLVTLTYKGKKGKVVPVLN
jgi:hypothetical protein